MSSKEGTPREGEKNHLPSNPNPIIGTVYFPGDDIITENSEFDHRGANSFVVIGEDKICRQSSVCLRSPTFPYKLTLYSPQKKYAPTLGDLLIGIVTKKNAEFFKVDINSPCQAILPGIDAFEGATKKNKPNLVVGSVVYCLLAKGKKDYILELSCKCADDQKSWISGGAYLGELKDGFVFNVPVSYAHSLAGDNSFILKRLSIDYKFEIAIGMNGRIWIKTDEAQDTIKIVNAINYCFGCSSEKIDQIASAFYNVL